MRIKLPISIESFLESIQKVKKTDNHVDFNKEEILLSKLGKKLGKSSEETKQLVSKDLLHILTIVPFTSK